jgi:hypothetical protein
LELLFRHSSGTEENHGKKPSVTAAEAPTEIRTEKLTDTNLELNRYTKLLGIKVTQ